MIFHSDNVLFVLCVLGWFLASVFFCICILLLRKRQFTVTAAAVPTPPPSPAFTNPEYFLVVSSSVSTQTPPSTPLLFEPFAPQRTRKPSCLPSSLDFSNVSLPDTNNTEPSDPELSVLDVFLPLLSDLV
ncbi:protein ORF147E [Cyprinid herpesvirus 1]|uniref:Protein ORF147E n=1 Tax=Cyprinid herpesvirus 1 TaxID=317858 RepID=K7PCM3_9VIRU|nr:protein ORF147E [Cyprinid herpesvirus 1]AFJ20455.1 protein ORF147E [Cyprinid herpesvirus 1]